MENIVCGKNTHTSMQEYVISVKYACLLGFTVPCFPLQSRFAYGQDGAKLKVAIICYLFCRGENDCNTRAEIKWGIFPGVFHFLL